MLSGDGSQHSTRKANLATMHQTNHADINDGPICELCGRRVAEPTVGGIWPPPPIGRLGVIDRLRVAWLARFQADVDQDCCCAECRDIYF